MVDVGTCFYFVFVDWLPMARDVVFVVIVDYTYFLLLL